MDDPLAATPTPATSRAARGRRRLARDLVLLAIVGALLIAAFAAGGAALYREFYSPTAFVLRYVELLRDGAAADARVVPGVALTPTELEAAGLPATASDALLRSAALRPLTDVEAMSEESKGDTTRVTLSYEAGGHEGTTTFAVKQDGWVGILPRWRFAVSPLAVMDLTVRGSMRFEVNGFEMDKRQVSAAGAEADPLAPVPLLVFSPGLYSVAVETPISATPGVAVLADAPRADIPVDIQAEPTEEFVGVVQEQVNQFLADCATQEVLQPTGCPFGYQVRNRIVNVPAWSIVQPPVVQVEPDGAGWKILAADAVAHIDVDIRSLFDGSVRTVSEDVPFLVAGTITVLPDGTASIQVSGGNS
ncbi:hypothetical protein ACTU3I_02735 [Microbacterium sp. RD1]|uniref:hypothetical protein n=1 Tax=Microbacterium sp. RD1 TaxID=3457313 RepID=UPI003FA612ED